MKIGTRSVPKHGEDYVIGTCLLDDGKRSIGIVFRDPARRDLYRVSMTVDSTHTKYSTVRVQFHKVGLLFRLSRYLDKSKVMKPFMRWLKKKRKTSSKVVEHKIKIPVEVCDQVTKAHALFNTGSLCSEDGACQIFIDKSWSGLSPITCMPKPHSPRTTATTSFDEEFENEALSLCFNPVSKMSSDMIQQLKYLSKS